MYQCSNLIYISKSFSFEQSIGTYPTITPYKAPCPKLLKLVPYLSYIPEHIGKLLYYNLSIVKMKKAKYKSQAL